MHVHHLALRVTDLERSRAFYGDLLGLPELRRQHDVAGALRAIWLRAGGLVLMLEHTLRGDGAQNGSAHLVAFDVDDLAAWPARLAARGVPIDDRTEHTLYLRDPDGHRVGLSDHVFDVGA